MKCHSKTVGVTGSCLLLLSFLAFASCSQALLYIPTYTHLGFGNGAYLQFNALASATLHHQGIYYVELGTVTLETNTKANFNFTSNTDIIVTSVGTWFNYTVASNGTQTFGSALPENVYIDYNLRGLGDGWEYSSVTGVTVTSALTNVAVQTASTEIQVTVEMGLLILIFIMTLAIVSLVATRNKR